MSIKPASSTVATPPSHPPQPRPPELDWIALVKEKVESLRYGVVQVLVHDGRVIQIERNEKTRLASGREGRPGE